MSDAPFDVRIQVGRVTRAEPFPATRKPNMMKLWIDLGEEKVTSCAQTAHHYDPGELVGRQILCATNLGTVNIAGFESQALTLGVPGKDGNPVLVAPDHDVRSAGASTSLL